MVNFTAGNIGGLFGLLADNAVSSPGPAPIFAGVQSNFWSQVYESTAGVTNFALNPNIGFPPAFAFLPGTFKGKPLLGALPDESIPILVDSTTSPETIFVHDSWEHDATITVLSEDGSHFIYSSLLGGSNDESATGIALDGNGDAYVAGLTMSSDFPSTPGAAQATLGSPNAFVNGFVAKLTSGDQD